MRECSGQTKSLGCLTAVRVLCGERIHAILNIVVPSQSFGEIFDFRKKPITQPQEGIPVRKVGLNHKTTATCVRKLILQKCICDHVKGLLNQMAVSSQLTFSVISYYKTFSELDCESFTLNGLKQI